MLIGGKTLQEIIELPRASDFIRNNGYPEFGCPEKPVGSTKYEVCARIIKTEHGRFSVEAACQDEAREKAQAKIAEVHGDVDDYEIVSIKEIKNATT